MANKEKEITGLLANSVSSKIITDREFRLLMFLTLYPTATWTDAVAALNFSTFRQVAHAVKTLEKILDIDIKNNP